jgi:hypothetical protein
VISPAGSMIQTARGLSNRAKKSLMQAAGRIPRNGGLLQDDGV